MSRSLPFSLGGAFATASYTGLWRNTKDMDLYILPRDREAMIAVVGDLGLRDYFDDFWTDALVAFKAEAERERRNT